jgi:16S rRNA C1402 N4-methylase RsmH
VDATVGGGGHAGLLVEAGAEVLAVDRDPDAIAATYLNLHRQQRSAWAWEIELRPWVENF